MSGLFHADFGERVSSKLPVFGNYEENHKIFFLKMPFLPMKMDKLLRYSRNPKDTAIKPCRNAPRL